MGKYSDVEALLIEEVRKYPVLWNTANPNYKNKTIKENAWIAVSISVNYESGKTYSILFSVFLLSLPPLAKVKKKEQTLVFTAAAIFLLAAQIKFTRSICFQPRPQSVCSAKTHVNVRKKAAQRKIILRNSGNCLRAFYLRT